MSKRPAAKSELNDQQLRFCEEYLKDLNATRAAIRAGYSENSAAEQGCRLLGNPKVQAKVQELMDERSKRTQIDADTILRELLRIATSDVGALYDSKGNLRPIQDIPEDARRAIAGIECDELFSGQGDERELIGVTKKVKLWDKTRGLELLGKHLKLFIDKVEHSADATLEDLLTGTWKKKEEQK